MSPVNADSMTNAQGEFKPGMPKSESLATSGHQPGQMVGNDAAPEFSAKVLPAGSAPKEHTYQPNPVNEVPGQALNPDLDGATKASDTLTGATSADVHTGIGKPIDGQVSSDLHHDGKSHRVKENQGLQGQAEGGSGLHGDDSAEARKLQSKHKEGPKSGQEFNVSMDGAETKESVGATEVAAMGQKSRKEDYDRSSYTAQGGPNA